MRRGTPQGACISSAVDPRKAAVANTVYHKAACGYFPSKIAVLLLTGVVAVKLVQDVLHKLGSPVHNNYLQVFRAIESHKCRTCLETRNLPCTTSAATTATDA